MNPTQPPAPSPDRLICVYGPSDRLSAPASCSISEGGARDLVKRELARWVNRSSGVQLTHMGVQRLQLGALEVAGIDPIDTGKPSKHKRRPLNDESCIMGPRVVERALMGSAYHQSLIEGWKGAAG